MKLRLARVARWLAGATLLASASFACGDTAPGSEALAQTELPAEGSCEAGAMLRTANEATEEQLDVDAELDSRAAANIVAARPFATLRELDEVAYVGQAALSKVLAYADTLGFLDVCDAGTCDETAVVQVANALTEQALDDEVGLDSRAAANIVAARPFATLGELDEVAYVGQSALSKLLAYAEEHGFVAACAGANGVAELGVVSDLDKTVVPPSDPDLAKAPYPGVSKLYQLLERRNGGQDGDMYYVTARTPELVGEVPAYLAAHNVPAGPIETGISGLPWVAEPEKIADVSAILDATGSQQFVLFGDSSHRDPEVYKAILASHGDRILAAFIHKVNTTVAPHRVEGLHLHESYAEVAAILFGYGVLTRDEALSVMVSAKDEGLAIDDDAMQQLLDEHAP